jgi:hypothetical protein
MVLQNPATATTNADTLVYRLTFSEEVTNVGSFSVLGNSTATVSNIISITPYRVFDVYVSGGDLATFNGTVSLGFTNTQITDRYAGNALVMPSNSVSYTLDNTAPTLVSFSSSSANGTYRIGDTINITATLSESVQSGSSFVATLDTGDAITLTAASAGTSLTGTYTVGIGDTSPDLTVSSFNVGTVTDTVGNTLTSTSVPTGINNIAGSKAIVVLPLAKSHITDFNADGKSDLTWHNIDGSVYAMTLNGAAFASGATVYGGLSADWQTLDTQGDYNGDGKSDVLFWNTTTHSAWMTQMNGSAISSHGYISYAQNLSAGWSVADSTADYNNDGKSDLLWWNSDTNTAFIALHNGATLTAEATLFSGIAGWTIQSAGGDYNGDGNDDILLWDASTSSLYMMTMNGTAISSQALISGGLTGWTVADALGDFNADGKSDILWRNAVSGQVWEYQMNGTSIVSTASVGTVDTSWQIVSAHNDFNADGKADILWKNTDGSAGISLMDGMTMGAITNLGAYTDWTVQNADNDVNADGKADLLWTKTDATAYVMEMDGVSILGGGQLGAYSGWNVMV